MAANDDMADATTLPAQAYVASVTDGTWQEFILPDLSGLASVSIKSSGDAVIAFDSDGVADDGAVSGTFLPISASDGWLRFNLGRVPTGQRTRSVFVAGNGGTPNVYVTAEGA